ncbi:MAG TPA: oligosaccharide flippase family protein [Sphingobium sp.]
MRKILDKVSDFKNLKTTIIGSSSRVFALAAQFAIVIALSRILEKSDFGNFMIVFSVYRLIGTSVGTGIASVLLYHIARMKEEDAEHPLHRFALLVGLGIGLLCCAVLFFASGMIAQAFAKPGIIMWLISMTPFLLLTLISTISTGAFEGRGQVMQAILFTETTPNFIRLVLLTPLPFLHLPTVWIAVIMAVSVAIPWLLSLRTLLPGSGWSVRAFTAWDYGYAAKLTVYNFAAYQVQGVDMIVAGSLFSSADVADYAIASRIASLFPFFLQLRVRMFGPVAARLLSENDQGKLQHEVRAAKYFSMVLVTLTVAALLIASPLVLTMFWHSRSVTMLLVLMAFPPVYRALFAAGDRLLQVAGHANWNLGIMAASFAVLCIIPAILAPRFGILSLPIAMIISGFILNPVISMAVRRKVGVILNRPQDMLVVAGAAAAVIVPLLLARSAYLIFCSGFMFLALGLAYAALHRHDLKEI